MSDTRKRRFWQIHLSTAIVLMFAAGAWIGINVIEQSTTRTIETIDIVYSVRFSEAGWPRSYRSTISHAIPVDAIKGTRFEAETTVHFGGAAVDVAVGMLILVATGLLSESLIRRREHSRVLQKNSNQNSPRSVR